MIRIHGIFVGQPRTIVDDTGTWSSSIFREPVTGPIELGLRGLDGDRVTDIKNHGAPDQAVCCHSRDHYDHWNDFYGLRGENALGPGSLGENWTLEGADEADICAGDVYSVGTARIQVAGPRIPCGKQDRKLGIAGFHREAGRALRTGFYLSVLTPGVVETGDAWRLEARPQPDISLHDMNVAWHREVDPELIRRMLDAQAVIPGWKRLYEKRLRGG